MMDDPKDAIKIFVDTKQIFFHSIYDLWGKMIFA